MRSDTPKYWSYFEPEDLIRRSLRAHTHGEVPVDLIIQEFVERIREQAANEIRTELLPQINPWSSERFNGMRAGVQYAADFIINKEDPEAL